MMLRQILDVAWLDLVRRIRNRSAFVVGFAGPVGLAVLFGLMLSGGGGGGVSVGVAAGPATEEFIARATANAPDDGPEVRYEAFADEASARRAVDDDEVGAAVVLRDPVAVDLVVFTRTDRPISAAVAEAVGNGVQDSLLGETPATSRPLEPEALGGRELSLAAYYGAAMPLLFLFFTTSLAAQSLLAEREDGTLARLLSTSISPAALVAGKVLAVFVLSVAGFAAAWVVTTVMADAAWGAPAGVIVLILASVAALAGIATFVASFASTARQAETLSSVVAFGLALLGGNLVSPGAMPDRLRQLRRLTPNGWALDGFVQLSTDSASVGSIAVVAAVLLVFAVGFGAAGLARVQRVVAP